MLGVGVLGLVLAPLGVDGLAEALARASWPHVIGVAGLTVPLVLARVERARVLLSPRPPWRVLFPILNASFLLAILTPGRAGAMLRPAWLTRHGVPAGATVVGLVAERVLDLVVVGALLAWTLVWAVDALPAEVAEGLRGARWLLGGGLVAGVVGLAALPRLRGPLTRGLAGDGVIRTRLRGFVASLTEASAVLAAQPRRAALAFAWTVVQWALGLAMGALLVHAVAPEAVTLRLVVTLWTGVMLANVVSPTPGGVGAYEAVGTAILVAFGLPAEDGAAAVLLVHLASLGTQAAFGVAGLGVMARNTLDDPDGDGPVASS